MEACGALYSHAQADIEKGASEINKLYFGAIAKIPYLTKGKTGDDMVTEERMKFIDRYNAMRDNLTPRKKDASNGN